MRQSGMYHSSPTEEPPRHTTIDALFQPQVESLTRLTISQRRDLVRDALRADASKRERYTALLDRLKATELLPEEFDFVQGDPVHNGTRQDDDDDDVSHASTTLTRMTLEDGSEMHPRHLRKITEEFAQRDASPAQPLPRRKRRGVRGSGSSHHLPQRPVTPTQAHLVDPSATSDAGTLRSFSTPGLHHGGGGGGGGGGSSIVNRDPDAAFPMPGLPPSTPNYLFSDRNGQLKRRREALLAEYDDALQQVIRLELKLRAFDHEMLQGTADLAGGRM